MRSIAIFSVAASAMLLAGCAATTSMGDAAPANQGPVQVLKDFSLYTHCGVNETRIGTDYYTAAKRLDDGSGNPPGGWGNPYQIGEMRVRPDGTATFVAGHLHADFVQRPGATTWLQICS